MGNAVSNVQNYTITAAENSSVAFGDSSSKTNDMTSDNKMVLDKPVVPMDPLPMKTTTYYMTTTDGKQITVALDDLENIIHLGTAADTLVKEQEMGQDFFTRTWSFVSIRDLNALADRIYLTPFQTLSNIAGFPQLVGYQFTPNQLEFYAMNFSRWRGGMEFRVDLICPILTNVKVAAVIKYGVRSASENSSSYSQASMDPQVIMDFNSDKRSFTFSVPWVCEKTWLTSPVLSSAPESVFESVFGVIEFWRVTTTAVGGEKYSSPPKLVIYTRMAEDAQFVDYGWPEACEVGQRTRNHDLPSLADWEEAEPIYRKSRTHKQSGRFGTTANVGVETREAAAGDRVEIPVDTQTVDLAALAAKVEFVSKYDVAVGTAAGLLDTWNFPESFIDGHMPYALEACAYWTGDLSIIVSVTTSSRTAGRAVLFYQPDNVTIDALPRDQMLSRIYSLQHVDIDLSSNLVQIFTIPYRHWQEKYVSSDFGVHGTAANPPLTGRLGLYLVNYQEPLDSASVVTIMLQRAWVNFKPQVTRGLQPITRVLRSKVIKQSGRDHVFKPPSVRDSEDYSKTASTLNNQLQREVDSHISHAEQEAEHVEKAPEHIPAQSSAQGIGETSKGLANIATESAILSRADGAEVISILDTAPKHAPARTPCGLRAMLKRPMFFKRTTVSTTASVQALWKSYQSPFEQLPVSHPIRRISKVFGRWTGDIIITTTMYERLNGTSLVLALMPVTGDTVNIVPLGNYMPHTGGTFPTPPRPNPVVEMSGGSVNTLIPYRAFYRLCSTSEAPENLLEQLVVKLDTPEGNGVFATLDVSISCGDGFTFTWFLGTPTITLALSGGLIPVTCDRLVTTDPPK